jgi:hypothetical protein
MRWAGHVASNGEGRVVYRVLVGKAEVKKPLGRPRHRCEESIKMGLQKLGCYGGMYWIELAQNRWRQDRWRPCECGNKASGSVKCGEFLY